MLKSSSSSTLRRLEEVGSSANWTCLPFRFPDLAEEEGLGFVSLDPTILYVDGECMEEGLEMMNGREG